MERNACGAPIKFSNLFAVSPENAEAMVQLLLAKGADLLSETNDGETPEALATGFERPQIAAVLKEAVSRAKHEAFAMAQHERLGEGSLVPQLEVGVVKMVLECV